MKPIFVHEKYKGCLVPGSNILLPNKNYRIGLIYNDRKPGTRTALFHRSFLKEYPNRRPAQSPSFFDRIIKSVSSLNAAPIIEVMSHAYDTAFLDEDDRLGGSLHAVYELLCSNFGELVQLHGYIKRIKPDYFPSQTAKEYLIKTYGRDSFVQIVCGLSVPDVFHACEYFEANPTDNKRKKCLEVSWRQTTELWLDYRGVSVYPIPCLSFTPLSWGLSYLKDNSLYIKTDHKLRQEYMLSLMSLNWNSLGKPMQEAVITILKKCKNENDQQLLSVAVSVVKDKEALWLRTSGLFTTDELFQAGIKSSTDWGTRQHNVFYRNFSQPPADKEISSDEYLALVSSTFEKKSNELTRRLFIHLLINDKCSWPGYSLYEINEFSLLKILKDRQSVQWFAPYGDRFPKQTVFCFLEYLLNNRAFAEILAGHIFHGFMREFKELVSSRGLSFDDKSMINTSLEQLKNDGHLSESRYVDLTELVKAVQSEDEQSKASYDSDSGSSYSYLSGIHFFGDNSTSDASIASDVDRVNNP